MPEDENLRCPDDVCHKRAPTDVRVKAYLFGEIFQITCGMCWLSWERQSDGSWERIYDF